MAFSRTPVTSATNNLLLQTVLPTMCRCMRRIQAQYHAKSVVGNFVKLAVMPSMKSTVMKILALLVITVKLAFPVKNN